MEAWARLFAGSGLAAMSTRLAKQLSTSGDNNHAAACQQSGARKAAAGGAKKNLVFSPLSIYSALSVVAAGARGRTLSELLDTLGERSRESLAKNAGNMMRRALPNDGAPQQPRGLRVKHACAIWHEKTRTVKPAFRDAAASSFNAVTRAVDFLTNPEEACKEINRWVATATENLIDTIISPGSVKTDTRLVVTSAIYFKGRWVTPFDKESTKKYKFHRLDGSDVDADFMRSGHDQYVAMHNGFKVLKMPYATVDVDPIDAKINALLLAKAAPWSAVTTDDRRAAAAARNLNTRNMDTLPRYSMCVFLPDERDGLWKLEEKMAAGGERFLRKHMPEECVEVGKFRIPRFKLSFDGSVKHALQGLGVKAVFDPARAELPDLLEECGHSGGNTPLFVSDVVHRAVIEVNEVGTEGAAASAVMVRATGPMYTPPPRPRVDFVADHPFAFVVMEESSGAILFAGHVVDPTK